MLGPPQSGFSWDLPLDEKGVDALFEPARYIAGFHSGLDTVDRLAGGLRPSTLTLLSSEPGVGKTALALAYVQNAARVDGLPTAIFSTAVTREHLLLRLIAAEARIPLEQFTKHGLDAVQRESALEEWRRMSRSPLFIDDSATDDRQEFRRSLWTLTQRSAVHFVVVDSPHGDRPRGWLRRPARAAEFLAWVARELDVAVLVSGKTPADDGRASWEQHADRIIDLRLPRNRGECSGHLNDKDGRPWKS